eukprot:542773-Rhodomonas_salina.1
MAASAPLTPEQFDEAARNCCPHPLSLFRMGCCFHVSVPQEWKDEEIAAFGDLTMAQRMNENVQT